MVERSRVFKAIVEIYHHSSTAEYPGRWSIETKYFFAPGEAESWLMKYTNKFFFDGKLVPITQSWQAAKTTIRGIQIFGEEES